MKNFMCPYCSYGLEAVIPPKRCPSCNALMVPPEEDEYHLPSMRFLKETTIEDYWYCKSCQMYRKNDGYKDPPPCPDCSTTDYHYNREPIFVVGVESYLEAALREAEKNEPELDLIRKYLRISYGWYERFNIIENDDDEDAWIDRIMDS